MSLQEFIAHNSAKAEFVTFDINVATVEEAAAALRVGPESFAKSLVLLASGIPVLVIICGNKRANFEQLSDFLGISKKKLKMAGASDVLELTGFPAGCVPPFGHKVKMRTLIDSSIKNHHFVFVGGGERDILLKISPSEIIRLTDGEILQLSNTI